MIQYSNQIQFIFDDKTLFTLLSERGWVPEPFQDYKDVFVWKKGKKYVLIPDPCYPDYKTRMQESLIVVACVENLELKTQFQFDDRGYPLLKIEFNSSRPSSPH